MKILGSRGMYVQVLDNKQTKQSDDTYQHVITMQRHFRVPVLPDGKQLLPRKYANINKLYLENGIYNADSQCNAWSDKGDNLNMIIIRHQQ